MADAEKSPAVATPAFLQPGTVPNANKGGKQSQLPPGYEIFKVRMPDGTIAKIKRKVDDAPASIDRKPVDASATTKKESTVISPAPALNPAPVNGEIKPISEKSTTTAVVQPTEPPPTSAKPATLAETTTSDVKSTTTTEASPKPGSRTNNRSRPSRFFTTFASRAAAALIPDLGEFHAGDEVLPSDDDSDGYDEDDNDNSKNNHGGQRDDSSIDQQQQSHVGNDVATAATKGLAGRIGTPPPAYKGNGEKSLPRLDEKDIGLVDAATAANAAKPGEAGANARSLESSFNDWTKYIIWAVMISFPILFIALGILTYYLPNVPANDKYAVGVKNSIDVAVSAWPIIFAAIAAQTLRSIANYKVERGIRVMSLEQLMGSNSVASSLKQPFLLRKFNLVTVALLLLWSLSPLATQALQRMSSLSTMQVPSKTNFTYLNTWTYNHAFSEYDATMGSTERSLIKKITLAATLPPGPLQQDYVDQYSFPKIPRIQSLDKSNADFDPDSYNGFDDEIDDEIENNYKNRSNSSSDTAKFFDTYITDDYSSNYGIPLQLPSLKGSDSLDFIISSSYLNFTCSNFTEVSRLTMDSTGVNLVPAENNTIDTTYLRILPINATNLGHLFYYRWLREQDTESSSTDDDIFAYSECEFQQTFVDSEITCMGNEFSDTDSNVEASADCFVAGVRYTNKTPENTPMSDFTSPFLSAVSDAIDDYLLNPLNLVEDLNGVNILQVNKADFTKRISLLVNTYWQLGFGADSQVGNYDSSSTPDHYGYEEAAGGGIILTDTPTYVVATSWLIALFVCSVFLLFAGVVNIILDTRTIVPDMLGFAASLARKSRYVDLPAANTSMSGPDRARLLADKRVMMQDVRPKAAVGRVALGYAREDAKRLEKGRLYR